MDSESKLFLASSVIIDVNSFLPLRLVEAFPLVLGSFDCPRQFPGLLFLLLLQ